MKETTGGLHRLIVLAHEEVTRHRTALYYALDDHDPDALLRSHAFKYVAAFDTLDALYALIRLQEERDA